MMPLTVARRDFSRLFRSSQGVLALFLALAGGNGLLLFLLRRAEGTAESFASLLGLTVSFGMPLLAAAAASRGFTRDRESGMMRLMFSTPVRARTWVLGKAFASWWLQCLYLIAMGVCGWILARWGLPAGAELPGMWEGYLFAGVMLALQALLWAGVGTLVSLLTFGAAAAAFLTLLICVIVPPFFAWATAAVFPELQTQWAWFPMQEAVYDSAGGIFDLRLAVGCLSFAAVMLYAAGFLFAALRVCGRER